MGLVSIGGGAIPYPEMAHRNAAVSGSNQTLDASDEYVAAIFQAPKTGTVSKIRWATATVTTGATIDVRVETVDTTTGLRTGTLWATNTNGAHVVGNGDDNITMLTTLTAGASVTKGDVLAVVFVNPTVSPGNMQLRTSAYAQTGNFPYQEDNLGGSAAKSIASLLHVNLEYNDGSYDWSPEMYPATSVAATATGTGSTPDELGNFFTMPFTCTASGFWIWSDRDGDCEVRLYAVGNDTPLATFALDKDIRAATTGQGEPYMFSSPVTLTKASSYRLVWRPTTATTLDLVTAVFPNTASLGAMTGGTNIKLTSRTDGATTGGTLNDGWTQTDTSRAMMGLMLSEIMAPDVGHMLLLGVA